MQNKQKTLKWLRIALYSILVIIVITIAGLFILNGIISGKIRQKLQALAPQAQVNIGAIHINLINGSLLLDDVSVSFRPDSGRTSHSHSIHIAEISVKGINFIRVASSKEFSANTILLQKADIELDRWLLENEHAQQAAFIADNKLSGKLNVLHVNLAESKISIVQNHQKQLSFQGNITLNDLTTHLEGHPLPFGGLSYSSFACSLSNLLYVLPGGLQNLHIQNLIVDSKRSLLQFDSLRMVPLYSKYEFGEKLGHQADRIDASIAQIKCEETDIASLLSQKLKANTIRIEHANVFVFRDRRLARPLINRPMPVKMLQQIPIDLRVNTLAINNSTITYEEFPKDGDQTGILKIEKFNATLSPLVNHTGSRDTNYLIMRSTGSLMGSGLIEATMRMPLQPGAHYYAEGSFHNVDLTTLNSSAENLGRFRIESGLLNKLDFYFDLDEEKSTGKIIGEYHNLVVDKLKKNGNKIDKFKTFALKNFIIPKDKDKSLAISHRTGKADYTRDPTRYPSYYLLKSLLKGIKSSFKLGFLLPG